MVTEESRQPQSIKIDDMTYRAEGFSALGFGHDDAWTLAHTKRLNGFYLYWGDVKKALDAGASHANIIDWFTYPETASVV